MLVLFSLLAQYFFIVMETFPPKKLDQWLMWTIMATICGNIAGIGPGRLRSSTLREWAGSRRV